MNICANIIITYFDPESRCFLAKRRLKMTVRTWEPENFNLEPSTVWKFPDHGSWATHDSSYRGNWSPYVPRNLILRYSREGDIVLDQFCGGGTTLVECKLLNRNCIGVDINKRALSISAQKCKFERPNCGKVYLREADARYLDFIPDEKIDLICTHPPYASIIKYSDGIEGDLSLLPINTFLESMKRVAEESFRVLKKDKYCAVLMGDLRTHGYVVPLGYRMMEIFQTVGFRLKELIIKEQYNCKYTALWVERSRKYNFLLLAHEHLLVFKKI
jgi:DNA modification methylase